MKTKAPSFPKVLVGLFFALVILFIPAMAKDQWLEVRSKNFLLIGNASEKDIRKVGTRLEQFRETFRQLFTKTNFTASIPTNVIVFKSDSAYKPFKPKRADGKLDTFVAGYFQPGEDVNYITLSTEGEDADTFGTIFHEYVHFIINTNFGKSDVPPWFNEGLAEYYQTFQIEEDQKVKLGLPQSEHLALLQQTKFIPLDELFKVSSFQLLQTGNHSRSIFYAESWALIHYLIANGKGEALNTFLSLVLKDTPPEKAFQQAFQITYADMEKALRKYVEQSSYKYTMVTFKNKLTFDADMQTVPLDEAGSNAYLGDLLYHVNRTDDAEPYLAAALKILPTMSMANTALGMVKLRQRKYDEAKDYLEKAIAEDQKNHMAYYDYAYLLSREGRDEFGYVKSFPPDSAAKMREALRKAIAIKPDFTESYELLAFVNLVNDEQLDESVALLKKALQYQPGNQRYAMRIAEILLHQSKFADASAIASKLASTTDDPEVKSRAESLAARIREMQQFQERQAEQRKKYDEAMANSGSGQGRPLLLKRKADEKPMTDADWARIEAIANLRSINMALRKPDPSEKRLVGHIQKIECKNPIIFTVKTETETFTLTSRDFQGLELKAFVPEAMNTPMGCGGDLSALLSVITYKEKTTPKSPVRGELLAVEFVPKDFKILSEQDMASNEVTVDAGGGTEKTDTANTAPSSMPPPPKQQDFDEMRRAAMMDQIKQSIRQPEAGEKRDMGYLDRIECTPKGNFFYMRTTTQTLKLLATSSQSPQIKLYTNDLEGVQFGCQLKPIEIPAVFVYKDAPNAKSKSAGEILTLEFVPKSFKLD